MVYLKKILPALALYLTALAPAVQAQQADNATGLAIGKPADANPTVGQTYVKQTFGDWQLRCISTTDGNDPCQLYQLMKDDKGNAVAEMSLFALPAGQKAVAGATIATPLETLLTKGVEVQVDGGKALRYPFTFCSTKGCFARIGLTADDIAAYKKGVTATITIVPLAAPDQPVSLTLSLNGFTAGFKSVSEQTQSSSN